ncbi:MAG: response regulator [Verrucomicrobia bacterium]|nr:response regulator [Verrucomicrobiota bacterium]
MNPTQDNPPSATTILLVDDDPFMLRLMDLILRDAGYEIIQARSGEEALEKIRESHSVDLVISDVVMPGMDGELLREHVTRLWPTCKFIVCSGYPDKCWDLANSAAHIATLPKPFTASALKERVREVLAAQ